jgi:hypothetical protein
MLADGVVFFEFNLWTVSQYADGSICRKEIYIKIRTTQSAKKKKNMQDGTICRKKNTIMLTLNIKSASD